MRYLIDQPLHRGATGTFSGNLIKSTSDIPMPKWCQTVRHAMAHLTQKVEEHAKSVEIAVADDVQIILRSPSINHPSFCADVSIILDDETDVAEYKGMPVVEQVHSFGLVGNPAQAGVYEYMWNNDYPELHLLDKADRERGVREALEACHAAIYNTAITTSGMGIQIHHTMAGVSDTGKDKFGLVPDMSTRFIKEYDDRDEALLAAINQMVNCMS